jgi:short-subunit dehydrogenase
MERTLRVNVLGAYYTLRAAGPHISHPRGYALPIASVGAVVHLPLMGAYSASKAAVEAIGNTLRIELRPSGARVGVGYFAEIDTDMTSRGFGTEAAAKLTAKLKPFMRVAPLDVAIDALERGIARRSRRVVAPASAAPLLPLRMLAQPFIDRAVQHNLAPALEIARREDAPLTTEQPA